MGQFAVYILVDVTDTTVVPAYYGHDHRVTCILHRSTIDTTVVYTTVVYVTDTTAARWRHTNQTTTTNQP